ncbi:MAG: dockerin type I repeat-containing protein [Dehalococcoidia bacterium]
MGRFVILALAVVCIGLSASEVAVAGPAPPPFTHELTFTNDTPFPADAMLAELSDYQWQIDLVDQPDRCPEPTIDSGGGFSANVEWGTLCVRPGEGVTLLVHGECDACPPPGTTHEWTHEDLGDADCNDSTDPIDAAVVLQFEAALLASITCDENADFNGNGVLNVIDAALILQLSAGLLVV